jgi:hypothetical protein
LAPIYEFPLRARNIYLLSLTFDHVLICTDNIAAFTRFASADIVTKVITSDWFRKLAEAGIIVLCGWGSNYGSDLMENQIAYSLRYRPELKPTHMLSVLRSMGKNANIVVREPSYGEKDHVLFLRDRIRYLEGQFTLDEVLLITELVEETQDQFGFVGTMEIFPTIDDVFLADPRKADSFYRAYYQSWQEYCTRYYTPAITVDSYRMQLPGRRTCLHRLISRDVEVISSLYAPEFFSAFLNSQIGGRVAVRLLDTRPERLIAVRNGDWKVFVERYHDCLESASQLAWIIAEANKLNLLADEKSLAEIVDSIFTLLDPNTDFASLGSLLDAILRTVLGTTFVGPLFSIFRSRINQKFLSLAKSVGHREFTPFLRKLTTLLLQRAPKVQLVTP